MDSVAYRGLTEETRRRAEAARRAAQRAAEARRRVSGDESEGSQGAQVAEARRRAQAAAQRMQTGQRRQTGQRGTQTRQRSESTERTETMEDDYEMEGGWGKRRMEGRGRRDSYSRSRRDLEGGWAKGAKKIPANVQKRLSKKPAGKSIHSVRSYKAIVNGKELTGTGKAGATKRYFHGEPAAAARKVVGQLNKAGQNVTGVGSAADIKLVEVTKGMRKADGSRYTYEYYGWRDDSAPKTVQKTLKKATTIGGVQQPAGSKISVTFSHKNKAVPKRDATSADAALSKSNSIGSKIKAKKGL